MVTLYRLISVKVTTFSFIVAYATDLAILLVETKLQTYYLVYLTEAAVACAIM
jgi:hypothetical protein